MFSKSWTEGPRHLVFLGHCRRSFQNKEMCDNTKVPSSFLELTRASSARALSQYVNQMSTLLYNRLADPLVTGSRQGDQRRQGPHLNQQEQQWSGKP
jgi:hypothetical protein